MFRLIHNNSFDSLRVKIAHLDIASKLANHHSSFWKCHPSVEWIGYKRASSRTSCKNNPCTQKISECGPKHRRSQGGKWAM